MYEWLPPWGRTECEVRGGILLWFLINGEQSGCNTCCANGLNDTFMCTSNQSSFTMLPSIDHFSSSKRSVDTRSSIHASMKSTNTRRSILGVVVRRRLLLFSKSYPALNFKQLCWIKWCLNIEQEPKRNVEPFWVSIEAKVLRDKKQQNVNIHQSNYCQPLHPNCWEKKIIITLRAISISNLQAGIIFLLQQPPFKKEIKCRAALAIRFCSYILLSSSIMSRESKWLHGALSWKILWSWPAAETFAFVLVWRVSTWSLWVCWATQGQETHCEQTARPHWFKLQYLKVVH